MDKNRGYTKTLTLLSCFVCLFIQSRAQTFAVIGDYGCSSKEQTLVSKLILEKKPDYIITTGDNNYPYGEASTIDTNIGRFFHSYIYPYNGRYGNGGDTNRFFPALGNHDLQTNKGKAHYDYFTLPGNERYYDVLINDVHIFILNSNKLEKHGVRKHSKQARWLKEKMKSSNANWKIIITHHPPYVSEGAHKETKWMQWPFDKWGADLVISGHEHVYERLLKDSLNYIVCGLGGAPAYGFGKASTLSILRHNSEHGALFIETKGKELQIRFITITGLIKDELFLKKHGSS